MSGTTPADHSAHRDGNATESRFRPFATDRVVAGSDGQIALQALVAAAREHVEQADRECVVGQPVIDAMIESGLFSLLRPDPERGPADLLGFFTAVRALAGAAPSAGWVAGMLGAAAWHIDSMAPAVRQEVWGSTPHALVTASHAPTGRLAPGDGGYLLQGEWPNLPAYDHCEWVALAALTTSTETKPVGLATVVVPRAELSAGERWNTTGLRGTGSRRVTARRVFVPAHRVHTTPRAASTIPKGRARERCPLAIVYGLAACMPVLGAVQGAFEDHLYRAGRRAALSLAGARAVSDPVVQAAVARGLGELDASVLQLERDAREAISTAASGMPLAPELRLRTRRDQVRAIERALAALEMLRRAAGADAVRADSTLDRAWRDVQTAAAHLVNQPEPALRLYGQWAFGLEVLDEMVIV
ncbi:hypothetical protein ABZ540_31310 [Nocardia xishanensis]|uniref:hypothetical protein n=1 Tax=Nocardia xishanensis TaxID=238964 RepID=UPI0033F62382